jgi:hypothetical protein
VTHLHDGVAILQHARLRSVRLAELLDDDLQHPAQQPLHTHKGCWSTDELSAGDTPLMYTGGTGP